MCALILSQVPFLINVSHQSTLTIAVRPGWDTSLRDNTDFTSGFTLVTHTLTLGKGRMTWTHYYSVTQTVVTALRSPLSSLHPGFPTPDLLAVTHLCSVSVVTLFLRHHEVGIIWSMAYSNQLSLNTNCLWFLLSFHDSSFLFSTNYSIVWMYQRLLMHCSKPCCIQFWGNYEWSCCKHHCADFCVDITSQQISVDIKEHNCGIIYMRRCHL